jgi:hypothetical protein
MGDLPMLSVVRSMHVVISTLQKVCWPFPLAADCAYSYSPGVFAAVASSSSSSSSAVAAVAEGAFSDFAAVIAAVSSVSRFTRPRAKESLQVTTTTTTIKCIYCFVCRSIISIAANLRRLLQVRNDGLLINQSGWIGVRRA